MGVKVFEGVAEEREPGPLAFGHGSLGNISGDEDSFQSLFTEFLEVIVELVNIFFLGSMAFHFHDQLTGTAARGNVFDEDVHMPCGEGFFSQNFVEVLGGRGPTSRRQKRTPGGSLGPRATAG